MFVVFGVMFVATILPSLFTLPDAGVRPVRVAVPLVVLAYCHEVFVAVVEGIVHYLVDYIKVKHGSKDNTKPIFWTQFGLDQLAHAVTYLWMVWYLLVY